MTTLAKTLMIKSSNAADSGVKEENPGDAVSKFKLRSLRSLPRIPSFHLGIRIEHTVALRARRVGHWR